MKNHNKNTASGQVDPAAGIKASSPQTQVQPQTMSAGNRGRQRGIAPGLLEKIQFHICEAQRTVLDKKWNSSFFHPAFRCILFSRLYLPHSGKGFIVCDGQTFTVQKGSLFLISPFARVHLSCPGRLVKYWCHFNALIPELNNDIFTMLPGVTEVKITDEQYSFYEKLFQRIISYWSGHADKEHFSTVLETLYANSAMTLLAAPFLNLIPLRNMSYCDADRIFKIIHYMNENLASDITLKDLAEIVWLHPNYLSTIFLRCMGMSPISFLSGLRMTYAVTELQRGTLRIGEIAERIGFNDKSSFSKFFNQRTGMSPRAWRERYNHNMKAEWEQYNNIHSGPASNQKFRA